MHAPRRAWTLPVASHGICEAAGRRTEPYLIAISGGRSVVFIQREVECRGRRAGWRADGGRGRRRSAAPAGRGVYYFGVTRRAENEAVPGLEGQVACLT